MNMPYPVRPCEKGVRAAEEAQFGAGPVGFPAPLKFVSADCHHTDNGIGMGFLGPNLSVVSGTISL